jgi:hypothetical protein
MEWPEIGYEENCISPDAAAMIKELLNPDYKNRIKVDGIKKHAFFKGIFLTLNKN